MRFKNFTQEVNFLKFIVSSSEGRQLTGASVKTRRPLHTVGRYQVNVASFEQMVIPVLSSTNLNKMLQGTFTTTANAADVVPTAAVHSGILERGPCGLSDVGPSSYPVQNTKTEPISRCESEEKVHFKTETESNSQTSTSTPKQCIVVIDEIGKMELYSQVFVESVVRLFEQSPPSLTGKINILATIPIASHWSHWLLQQIRQRKDCILFEVRLHLFMRCMVMWVFSSILQVTERNRDSLVKEISQFFLQQL